MTDNCSEENILNISEDEANEEVNTECVQEEEKIEVEDFQKKAEEYYGRLQRLQAEFDNFRKRTRKEKEETAKYALEKIIGNLLPVLDNFKRAVEASQTSQDFEIYSKGINMILRQFVKVLEDEGLKEIEAVGQEFDPNIHEALMQVESDESENVVLEELEKGYYLKDKVIRPTKVKVSC
ncbi:MAG: nucleotide exchange factor GrpE [Eubacteriales bacterium]